MFSANTIGDTNLRHVCAALEEALQIARGHRCEWSYALCEIAARFASIDPDRAVGIALSVGDTSRQDKALWDIVEVVAESDPQRAIGVARGITSERTRVEAFSSLLEALEPGSPLIGPAADEAGEIARSIEGKDKRDEPPGLIVRAVIALARLNPDRALEVARGIRSARWRRWAIWQVVVEVGKTDFVRALEIERGIKYRKAEHAAGRADAVRAGVADALATTAPDKAKRLARSITDPAVRALTVFRVTLADSKRSEKRLRRASGRLLAFARAAERPEGRAWRLGRLSEAWTDLTAVPPKALQDELSGVVRHLGYRDSTRNAIAKAVVEWDPDAALGIIEGLERDPCTSTVEERAFCKLAATDPQRALMRARNVKCRFCRADALRSVASTLAAADAAGALATIQAVKSKPTRMSLMRGWAEEVAKTDPDRAIAMAHRKEHEDVRVEMLQGIAEALACSDVRRAVKVARMISDRGVRCHALLGVAARALPQKRDR